MIEIILTHPSIAISFPAGQANLHRKKIDKMIKKNNLPKKHVKK